MWHKDYAETISLFQWASAVEGGVTLVKTKLKTHLASQTVTTTSPAWHSQRTGSQTSQKRFTSSPAVDFCVHATYLVTKWHEWRAQMHSCSITHMAGVIRGGELCSEHRDTAKPQWYGPFCCYYILYLWELWWSNTDKVRTIRLQLTCIIIHSLSWRNYFQTVLLSRTHLSPQEDKIAAEEPRVFIGKKETSV